MFTKLAQFGVIGSHFLWTLATDHSLDEGDGILQLTEGEEIGQSDAHYLQLDPQDAQSIASALRTVAAVSGELETDHLLERLDRLASLGGWAPGRELTGLLVRCDRCSGDGEGDHGPCPDCDGHGVTH